MSGGPESNRPTGYSATIIHLRPPLRVTLAACRPPVGDRAIFADGAGNV